MKRKNISYSSILLLLLALSGCKHERGEYVFIDDQLCIHATQKCKVLKEKYAISYVRTDNLYPSDFSKICSQCISIEDYNDINRITNTNITIRSRYKKIYDIIAKDYVLEDFEVFKRKYSTYQKREILYNYLKDHFYKIGDLSDFNLALISAYGELNLVRDLPIDEEKAKAVYSKLINSGKVSIKEIGDIETFPKACTNEERLSIFYQNLINSGKFTKEEIGSQEKFIMSLCSKKE